MSPEEVRKLFNQWKIDGKRLRISLWQDGQTSLWCSPTDWEANESEVKFWFGFKQLAWGEVVIPFSDLLVIESIDAKSRPLEDFDPAFESCIEFSWKYLTRRERCVICVSRYH